MRRSRIAAIALWAAAVFILAPQVAFAEEPKARIEGELERTLRAELQRAVGVTKTRPATRVDARRRARDAGEAVIAVLRSEGYYDYLVEPDVGEGDAPEALVRVTPGPRSTLVKAEIVWDGTPPDPDTAAAAEKALAMPAGAPGRAADVLAAEGRIVAIAKKRGYADAAPHPRQVIVDHETHGVEATFHIASGGIES